MAYTEQALRTGFLADIVGRIVDAALSRNGSPARRRRGQARHHPGRSLDAGTRRDSGAGRAYLDYATSAPVAAGSDRRLHRIAEAARIGTIHA